jgi:hypothetical protein
MPGPKQKLSPEKYKIWLEQHRAAEKIRRARIKEEASPLVVVPVEQRPALQNAYGLDEMFWHPLLCECGSCKSIVAPAIKAIRMEQRPIPPAVKARVSHLPQVPSQLLPLLQAAEAAALLKVAEPSTPQSVRG